MPRAMHAWHNERCRSEAVNWGDFGCPCAELFVTDDGEQGIRVFIEEADPNCFAVEQFVADYLKRHGFPDVVVVASW